MTRTVRKVCSSTFERGEANGGVRNARQAFHLTLVLEGFAQQPPVLHRVKHRDALTPLLKRGIAGEI